MTGKAIDPEIAVPAGQVPPARCPYCERPFRSDRASTLHVGEAHPDRCTDAEREAYEEARAAERDELFFYHTKVVVALGIIYAVMVLAYMAALGGGLM